MPYNSWLTFRKYQNHIRALRRALTQSALTDPMRPHRTSKVQLAACRASTYHSICCVLAPSSSPYVPPYSICHTYLTPSPCLYTLVLVKTYLLSQKKLEKFGEEIHQTPDRHPEGIKLSYSWTFVLSWKPNEATCWFFLNHLLFRKIILLFD